MTVTRSGSGRFYMERLYAPASVAVAGTGTPERARVEHNLRAGGFHGRLMFIGGDSSDSSTVFPNAAALPEAPDLVVLTSPAVEAAALLRELGQRGARAGVALSHIPGLAAMAADSGVRMLGPSSFGLAVPRLGLNASLSHMPLPPGRVALLTQSASLARAVVDWAGPNGVGFSHVIGVGDNTDLGFGLALDWLSRDPGTGLILLDIRRVRSRRAFISAARAASRLRPMVAIRPGGLLMDPSGQADAVFAAALNRAGVFVVRHLEELLAAAETLSRSKPARGEALAVVTNAIGPGRLAADAALEAGIKLALLPPEAQSALAASLPAELIYGLVYAGSAAPTQVAELAAMLSAVPDVGGVLVILAPTGAGDGAAVEAVVAAATTAKMPVLACVMGETSGAAHRRRLAEAGLPVFATPEQAVRAFGHLLRDRAARIAARELPGRRVLDVAPDHDTLQHVMQQARQQDRLVLSQIESTALLSAYGIVAGQGGEGAQRGVLHVHDDPTFGPAIGLATRTGLPTRYELPPLNLTLAQGLARRAGVEPGSIPGAAQLLARVSQLLVDEPTLASIAIDPLWIDGAGALCGGAAIALRPLGEQAILAIPPYPEQLIGTWEASGEHFVIRPIRPEDAQAHAAFMSRVPPEDVRYRFFSALREISPEQMARLTQIDYEREMAFVAVRPRDQATVGVARLVREAGAARGEFAIVVQPDAKGIGLASHLMQRLIGWARDVGIQEITGSILSENTPMLAFVRHLGFTTRRLPDEPDVAEAVLVL
jgi:acyl-CoA synthetase (NDP forming)/GNAT superfamily N-acetyltransferase